MYFYINPYFRKNKFLPSNHLAKLGALGYYTVWSGRELTVVSEQLAVSMLYDVTCQETITFTPRTLSNSGYVPDYTASHPRKTDPNAV